MNAAMMSIGTHRLDIRICIDRPFVFVGALSCQRKDLRGNFRAK